MVQDDSFEKEVRPYQERSRDFLEKIDHLDAQIAATANQKALRANLERDRAKLRREFAQHLGDQTYIGSDSRAVVPIWRVTGVPSKRHKGEAQEWMRERDIVWTGSAPALRHEVRQALEVPKHLAQKQHLPENMFGLHVERTIDVKMPRAFTVNLLGKPHHIVAPATETTNAEIKDERARAKFFRGED